MSVTKIERFALTDVAIEGYGKCNGTEYRVLCIPYTYKAVPSQINQETYQEDIKLCTLKMSYEFLTDLIPLLNHSLNVINANENIT